MLVASRIKSVLHSSVGDFSRCGYSGALIQAIQSAVRVQRGPIPPVMLPMILSVHYLITRASREPILAAARARSAKTALVR